MTNTETHRQRLELYAAIPETIRCGLIHAIVYGYPPGGFLSAVFSNDLMETFGRADPDSVRGLHATLTWIHTFAPRGCWGSPDALKNWNERRIELLPHCSGLKEGLKIFQDLGDDLARQASEEIFGVLIEE